MSTRWSAAAGRPSALREARARETLLAVTPHDHPEAGAQPPDTLVIGRHDVDGATVLAVGGEVDLLTVPDLTAALGDPAPLVLDLTAVTFLDSAGINAILRASQNAEKAGARLLVVAGLAGDGVVARTLRLSGADGLLALAPTVPAALARLRDR